MCSRYYIDVKTDMAIRRFIKGPGQCTLPIAEQKWLIKSRCMAYDHKAAIFHYDASYTNHFITFPDICILPFPKIIFKNTVLKGETRLTFILPFRTEFTSFHP